MFWELVIAIPFTLMFGTFFGYVIHKALHNKKLGPLYKSHLIHHFKLYPVNDFVSTEYRQSGKDSTTWIFLVASLPIAVIPILLWLFNIISLLTMIIVLAEMAIIGFLNSWIHDSFHISNHWLNTSIISNWYRRWLNLHFQHHADVKTNFGIFSFIWDRLLGTFSTEAKWKKNNND